MATTTPNFGWAVPTSTDLVKDGAVAIETLGDSIDASLVDLKGGTTGQVLAKASATDMDFAWVAQDDSNAIQNAIVDAKGDLIAATAADTPARLAVGTNGQVLTADSTASTGLAYTNKGWTLLASSALSGASVTFSSIPSSYKSIKLIVIGMQNATADGRFTMRPNGAGTGFVSGIELSTIFSISNADIRTQANLGRTNADNNFVYTFDEYAQAINLDKNISGSYFYVDPTGNNRSALLGGMTYTSAITSIVILNTGGDFTAGNAYLWGIA